MKRECPRAFAKSRCGSVAAADDARCKAPAMKLAYYLQSRIARAMYYPKMRLGHIKSSMSDSIGKSDEPYGDVMTTTGPPCRPSRFLDYPTVSCLEPVNLYKSQQIIAKRKTRAVVERLADPMSSSNAGIARQRSIVVKAAVRVHAEIYPYHARFYFRSHISIQDCLRSSLGKSMAWLADRRRDPAPTRTQGTGIRVSRKSVLC
jgi:hypothetical protein